MKTRVRKWGNSLALRIPTSFASEVGMKDGSPVEVSVTKGKVIVAPAAEPKWRLTQLLAQVTSDNLHDKVETGPAVGREAW